ncbi:MAG: hypothetical protein NTX56_04555, partial [Proteobacteria bacterium]|nr:hypothetical protein [Pseudomonadota bacterium]
MSVLIPDDDQVNLIPDDGTGDSSPFQKRTTMEAIGTGLRDPLEAGAQLLAKIPGADYVNQANNWLADKTGLVARLPEGGMDEVVRKREAAIQASRGGDNGIDWWRLAGSAAPTAALSMVGGAAAPATLLGRVAGGALSGAGGSVLQPSTAPDFWKEKGEQGVIGALTGGALGAAGHGLASALTPKFRPNAQTLIDEGVQMTPGQLSGGYMKRAEDILGSVPFVGSLVRSGQRASIDSFNNAAINRALEPIGETLPKGVTAGREAIAAAESKLGAAYNKLMPKMVGQLDNDLQSDIVNIAQLGANLPDKLADELNRVIKIDVLGKFSPGGGISGKTLQEIGTDLRNMSQRMAASESP